MKKYIRISLSVILLFFILNIKIFCGEKNISYWFDISNSYDSFANLKKYNHIIGIQEGDSSINLNLGINYINQYSTYSSLSMIYKLNFLKFNKLSNQNSKSHTLDFFYREDVNPYAYFIILFNTEYLKEDDYEWDCLNNEYYPEGEWDYFQYGLGGNINIFDITESGPDLKIDYSYSRRKFIGLYSHKIRENFNNTSYHRHIFDLNLSKSHGSIFLTDLDYIYTYKIFDHNISSDLMDYTGQLINRNLTENINTILIKETAKFSENISGSIFYEYSDNDTNSIRYSYWANKLGLEISIKPAKEHEIIISGFSGVFDYHKDIFNGYFYKDPVTELLVFDSRGYSETRKNFKKTGSLKYIAKIREYLTLTLECNSDTVDSTDSRNYDPAITASYTSYSRTIYNLAIKASF